MSSDEMPSDFDRTGRSDASRTIRDPDGQIWLVREFVRWIDGRLDRSLLFDSGTAIRRVRDFPAEWRSLSDLELAGISRRR